MKKDLIHFAITLILMVALLWLPPMADARPDPPPLAAECVVIVIGVTCVTIMCYGLWRMCAAIPDPNADPPYGAPLSEVPGIGPPTFVHKLPPLWLRNQMMSSRVSLEHRDSDGQSWQTDYTFATTQSQIGGLAMVAYDSNGIALVTNDVPIINLSGDLYAPLMFTNLPPASTNNPAGRVFRLHAQ